MNLAKRYARALLDLAREAEAREPWGEELGRAAAVFAEPRLRPLVLSRAIDPGARLETVRAVVEAAALSPMVRNLVLLLAERDRLPVLPDVSRWYDALVDEELDRARAIIWSAAPLGDDERQAIVDLARRLSTRRQVLATTETEAELLGGVVLEVAGTVYDGSLRSQLERLSEKMTVGDG